MLEREGHGAAPRPIYLGARIDSPVHIELGLKKRACALCRCDLWVRYRESELTSGTLLCDVCGTGRPDVAQRSPGGSYSLSELASLTFFDQCVALLERRPSQIALVPWSELLERDDFQRMQEPPSGAYQGEQAVPLTHVAIHQLRIEEARRLLRRWPESVNTRTRVRPCLVLACLAWIPTKKKKKIHKWTHRAKNSIPCCG